MIFDGHIDIFADVVIKRLNGERDIIKKYHLDRLNSGGIIAGSLVLWIDPPFTENPKARLEQILKTTRDELDESDVVRVITTSEELRQAQEDGVFAILLGMEGLSGIDDEVERLYELYDFGVRQVMLTWNEENTYAAGAGIDNDKGLTDLGKKAIDIIQEKKMVLDVSHLNEKSFWDIAKYTQTPLLASHSNAKSLANAARNLTDDQLSVIKDIDGLVGVNSYRVFVSDKEEDRTTQGYLKQLAYIADKIGVERLSFGFDFMDFLSSSSLSSFTEGTVYWIDGLEKPEKIPTFLQEMRDFGFSEEEIKQISYSNWFNFIKKVIG